MAQVPTPRHDDFDEQLPAYENTSSAAHSASSSKQHQGDDVPRPEVAFPSRTADALEVREYLKNYFERNADTYNLNYANSAQLAGNWRHGSGQELRLYDRATWEGLFGLELGVILLEHVKHQIALEQAAKEKEEDEEEEEKKKKKEELGYGGLFALAITFIGISTFAVWLFVFGTHWWSYLLSVILFLPSVLFTGAAVNDIRKLYQQGQREHIQLPQDDEDVAGDQNDVELGQVERV